MPRALAALVLLVAGLLAGCTGSAPEPGPTRAYERQCLEPAVPTYSGNARLIASLGAAPLEVAEAVAGAANDTLQDPTPSDSDTQSSSGWTQWRTQSGTVTHHAGAAGFTRVLLKGDRVWPSTNEKEATSALDALLDALGAPQAPVRNLWSGANHTPPVDFLQARAWQSLDGVAVTGSETLLSVQNNSSPFGSNDTTLEVLPLYDLSGARASVTWGRAISLGASTLRCVFAQEGRLAGDTSNLREPQAQSFSVAEDSLMWRVLFRYGADCDAERERAVLIDADTGAVHSVGNARRACVDRH